MSEGCREGWACYTDLDANIMADLIERAVTRIRGDWADCGPRSTPAQPASQPAVKP